MSIEDEPIGKLVRVLIDDNEIAVRAARASAADIERVISYYVEAIRSGGKVIYFGAGTSGRIGFMDAAELYPTFGVGRESVIPLIAGGVEALQRSIEGAEDDMESADKDFYSVDPKPNYLFLGLSATGRTPYVIEILRKAKEIRARTAVITCTPGSLVTREADLPIVLDVGEEVIKGSTRLKSGTAEKIVLNAISTTSMMKLGKTRKGLMTNMIPLNSKLRERAVDIVVRLVGCPPERAKEELAKNHWNIEQTLKALEAKS